MTGERYGRGKPLSPVFFGALQISLESLFY